MLKYVYGTDCISSWTGWAVAKALISASGWFGVCWWTASGAYYAEEKADD